MAGVGDGYDDIQSPNDVTVSLAHETGNQITIVVGIVQDRSNVFLKAWRTVGRTFIFSCQQAFRRKYTLLFLLVPLLCIATMCFFLLNVLNDGFPTSAESLSSTSRFLTSLATLLVVALVGFYIINLRLTSLVFGITWMFVIIAIMYFLATSLVAAIRFDTAYVDPNSRPSLFDVDIADYMKNLHEAHPGIKFPKRFQTFMKKNKCCDFTFLSPKDTVNATSFWDYIYLPNKKQERPPTCCGLKTATKTCFLSNVTLLGTCNTEIFLKDIALIIDNVLAFDVLFLLLSILMAFVFWYYYSDLKGKEFASEEQPGDYEPLTTTQIHEDETESQVDPKTQAEYDAMVRAYYSAYAHDPYATTGVPAEHSAQ